MKLEGRTVLQGTPAELTREQIADLAQQLGITELRVRQLVLEVEQPGKGGR